MRSCLIEVCIVIFNATYYRFKTFILKSGFPLLAGAPSSHQTPPAPPTWGSRGSGGVAKALLPGAFQEPQRGRQLLGIPQGEQGEAGSKGENEAGCRQHWPPDRVRQDLAERQSGNHLELINLEASAGSWCPTAARCTWGEEGGSESLPIDRPPVLVGGKGKSQGSSPP